MLRTTFHICHSKDDMYSLGPWYQHTVFPADDQALTDLRWVKLIIAAPVPLAVPFEFTQAPPKLRPIFIVPMEFSARAQRFKCLGELLMAFSERATLRKQGEQHADKPRLIYHKTVRPQRPVLNQDGPVETKRGVQSLEIRTLHVAVCEP